MYEQSRTPTVFAAIVLACGIAAAGYFASLTLYKARVALNTAEVKGLAERRVQADQAFWKIEYTVAGKEKSEIPGLYSQSARQQEQIITLLKASGFTDSEIVPGVIDYRQEEFRDEGQRLIDVKHMLIGSLDVQTDKVQLVSKVRAKMNELIAQGIDIKNNPPAFYFTRLNEIKPAMLKEATTNARIAANEFAANAGVKVGGIREAHQGGFVVADIGENFGDRAKIDKEVRVVTNITFYLTD